MCKREREKERAVFYAQSIEQDTTFAICTPPASGSAAVLIGCSGTGAQFD